MGTLKKIRIKIGKICISLLTLTVLTAAGGGALLSTTGIGGLGIQVGLGFYLPFSIVLTYTIGTVLRIVSDRTKGRHFSEQAGIPIAAGLIIGEGLVGVGFAVYSVIVGMKGG